MCLKHSYSTAEFILWHMVKQLIFPPGVTEVAMWLGGGAAWDRFVCRGWLACASTDTIELQSDTVSSIIQYDHTVGNLLFSLNELHIEIRCTCHGRNVSPIWIDRLLYTRM